MPDPFKPAREVVAQYGAVVDLGNGGVDAPPAVRKVNIGIVSGVRLHREGLARLLSGCRSIRVVGAYAPCEALIALRSGFVDVALVDVLRPTDTEVIDALREPAGELRVIAVGIRESASEILSCAAHGIDAYVSGDANLSEMVAAIENAMRGGAISRRPLAGAPSGTTAGERPLVVAPLTARELQVADLMNRGLSNKEIARRLDVQPCTAKNHVRNILLKLGVHRRGRAVAKLRTLIGERFGLMRPSDP